MEKIKLHLSLNIYLNTMLQWQIEKENLLKTQSYNSE